MYAITSHNCVHSENSTKHISEIILQGFCKNNNSDDTYDTDENNTCFLMMLYAAH